MGVTLSVRDRSVASGLLLVLFLTGCTHAVRSRQPGRHGSTCAGCNGPGLLQDHLAALAPTVCGEEARRAAAEAYASAQELAEQYRLVQPPLFHNCLVNAGLKRRGLCYHWTEDMRRRLSALDLSTLELRWGVARPGTWREHNSVVVTAKGGSFAEGIVLDAWRGSGRLCWAPVAADRYAWEESVAR